ncbi:hypothetical protein I7I50_06235 [Histoplasma capsulatum G186AR]|uniref:Uncharacterized protein n=1 Tax=Ajellomyces capsulatus TaxID=5037 RepID=A0A8H7Z2X3_AJECA|nr:hypothetical protein I7I52_10692 [Histoplasma capsulatum]QSS67222.1 hypothetical protein I7I50_06235 [Histoplasma capsulatum G186AR]
MLHLTLYLMFTICKYILVKGLGVSLLFLFFRVRISLFLMFFYFFPLCPYCFTPLKKSIGIQGLDNRYTPLKYIPSTFTTFTQFLLLGRHMKVYMSIEHCLLKPSMTKLPPSSAKPLAYKFSSCVQKSGSF